MEKNNETILEDKIKTLNKAISDTSHAIECEGNRQLLLKSYLEQTGIEIAKITKEFEANVSKLTKKQESYAIAMTRGQEYIVDCKHRLEVLHKHLSELES